MSEIRTYGSAKITELRVDYRGGDVALELRFDNAAVLTLDTEAVGQLLEIAPEIQRRISEQCCPRSPIPTTQDSGPAPPNRLTMIRCPACDREHCLHACRRQTVPPEVHETDRGPMLTRLWECPDCGDQWTTTRRRIIGNE